MTETVDEAETTEVEVEQTLEQAQQRVAELEAELAQAGRTMIEFRAKVRTEAMAMAEQHNLCTVVENTLRKVGIDSVRRRVDLVWTYQRTMTYEVPEELLTLLTPEQFIRWATTGTLPRGRTQRDFRGVRAQNVAEQPVGEATMTIMDPGATPASPIGVAPPPDHLAAYSSDDGRVLHFVPINGRSIELRHGHYRDMQNATALCGCFGYWRADSPRAARPPRACERCAASARVLGILR